MQHTIIPTATGWTVYSEGQVVGWIRRGEDADESYERKPGTYWVIRPGKPARTDIHDYATLDEAAATLVTR